MSNSWRLIFILVKKLVLMSSYKMQCLSLYVDFFIGLSVAESVLEFSLTMKVNLLDQRGDNSLLHSLKSLNLTLITS